MLLAGGVFGLEKEGFPVLGDTGRSLYAGGSGGTHRRPALCAYAASAREEAVLGAAAAVAIQTQAAQRISPSSGQIIGARRMRAHSLAQ